MHGHGRSSCSLPEDAFGLALFLDIDGTLLDIAQTPEAVVVPPGLPESLKRLAERLEGALALITGRSIGTVDALFRLPATAVSGLHGAEWRGADGRTATIATTEAFELARRHLRRQTADMPGVVFEDKGAAIAAHYRLAPEREAQVRELMEAIAGPVVDGWELQEGKQVVELRPRGRDKGDALVFFMSETPFRGRRPVAVGDDVTDEAMFAAANRLDGLSVRVGLDGRQSLARGRVRAPSDVRDWLARISA
ncbi:trehalose 6-phosphate phosphatase [Aquamicrobium lusatiense]|uniref:Trehalose 6-phosphate phosphatase n=1 Tax=Aquamicrobium lusatiense TaxID=89772 RepID=A0A7W9S4P6_9HYPH|nr:trehalose-phosphatase [Aquamicrobium lusatiense]MBB6014067.1 trehalose 6-phosphate phosphatase [Aquamicrobium lusatiense]